MDVILSIVAVVAAAGCFVALINASLRDRRRRAAAKVAAKVGAYRARRSATSGRAA